MDNLTRDKIEDDLSGCRSETGNKRKRHYSLTESLDESPKKKTATTTSAIPEENNENATSITNGDGGAEDDKTPLESINIDNEEELQSQFLLEELCDEVLYEIFKFLDTWSLMALMNVCKRFQKFVLDKRLWENIDLSQEPLPLGILEDMLERSHDKTKSIKLRGPSPSQHIEGEIQHFNQTIRNSLTTRCTKLVTLELYGVTLDFNQITLKDFPQTLKRLILNTCNVRVVSNKSLFTGIDTILVNLEELAIENNSWFDPYYVMPLSKLPLLRYLSLKGCWLMQEFIPYGSIAARHGFKQLEILDLRDTPLNDSDLQCFNAVETLKEIYLQCPEEEEETSTQTDTSSGTRDDISHNQEAHSDTNSDILTEMPSTSSNSAANANSSLNSETPSTSRSLTGTDQNEDKPEKTKDSLNTPASLSFNDSESMSSSSSSSSSSSPKSSSITENNAAGPSSSSTPSTSSPSFSLSPNIVPLVGTNAPARSRFLPRPDHIFYLNVRNRISIDCSHVNVRDHNIIRPLRRPRQSQHQQNQPQQQQQSPPPVIEQMMRHNLFWDIVNPLGRVVGVGGPDRLFGEENGAEYHLNLFSLSSSYRQQSRGTISDRGVCCFGRTRQPVQQGVVWIRFNNRPFENSFERFSVRDYKSVTDVSLQHLVQCSPRLIFLDVSGTSVTLDGLQRFKDLKPECKVVAEHLLGVTKSETTVS
ncbi:uncharacterized protein LOC135963839 [Calliphora vicina]|uniref:uncharacterized protein LOC135963839 n=1 Tax=Calliphora vicina TaxID=7373 RepID=UPI00325A819D